MQRWSAIALGIDMGTNTEAHTETIGNCRDVITKLYEFLDGELTEQRKALVTHHLDTCASCLEAFEFEAELRAVLISKLTERCPDVLLSRIATLIKNEKVPEA